MLKYRVENENGITVREFRTFRGVITEVIGKHYSSGSYSMCLVGDCRIYGLTVATRMSTIQKFIDYVTRNESKDFSLNNFWHFCAWHLV